MIAEETPPLEINTVDLVHLNNEEHFQFHSELNDSITKFGAENLNIRDGFLTYQTFYAQENEALQVIRKSSFSKKLADADRSRDIIEHGFVDAIKSALNHFNADKQDAALRIKIMLDQYGNIAQKPYNEETASINKLVQETQSTYKADIALLALEDWIIELDTRNTAFDTLMKSRYTETAGKTELRMKHVRKDIDAAYRKIIKRIESLMVINGPAGFEVFIRELNARADKYNNILAQRKGMAAKNKDNTPAK